MILTKYRRQKLREAADLVLERGYHSRSFSDHNHNRKRRKYCAAGAVGVVCNAGAHDAPWWLFDLCEDIVAINDYVCEESSEVASLLYSESENPESEL